MPLKIKIKYASPESKRLEKIAIGDWIDMFADKTVSLGQGERGLIPLGVAIQLPAGYEAHLAPRSSTFKTWGIIQTNSPGIIDESYCGDNDWWFMPVHAMRATTINAGDKICHFRIVEKMQEVCLEEVESLGNADRGGLGSTGKR
jgi:dUTP pyrophosphatase